MADAAGEATMIVHVWQPRIHVERRTCGIFSVVKCRRANRFDNRPRLQFLSASGHQNAQPANALQSSPAPTAAPHRGDFAVSRQSEDGDCRLTRRGPGRPSQALHPGRQY